MDLSKLSVDELVDILYECNGAGQCSKCCLIAEDDCRARLSHEVIRRIRWLQDLTCNTSISTVPDQDLIKSLRMCRNTAASSKCDNCALRYLRGTSDCYSVGLGELIHRYGTMLSKE